MNSDSIGLHQPTLSQPPTPSAPPLNDNFEALDCCPVCFDLIHLDHENVKKTQCEHTFHESCLNEWLTNKRTCPVCRAIIVVVDEGLGLVEWQPGQASPAAVQQSFQSSYDSVIDVVSEPDYYCVCGTNYYCAIIHNATTANLVAAIYVLLISAYITITVNYYFTNPDAEVSGWVLVGGFVSVLLLIHLLFVCGRCRCVNCSCPRSFRDLSVVNY